jgi:hypothetical protein
VTAFKSYSQCGQDRFALAVLNGKTDGLFAEIGTSHPIEINNTYGLEQIGWRGFMVDNDPGCIKLLGDRPRKSPFIFADATKLAWNAKSIPHFGEVFDFLSLDVDAATVATLRGIPLGEIRFRVATIEHDAYRFGNGPRNEMREIMWCAGYILVCSDVKNQGMEFEDWWVHNTVPGQDWVRFMCEKLDWAEIMEKI